MKCDSCPEGMVFVLFHKRNFARLMKSRTNWLYWYEIGRNDRTWLEVQSSVTISLPLYMKCEGWCDTIESESLIPVHYHQLYDQKSYIMRKYHADEYLVKTQKCPLYNGVHISREKQCKHKKKRVSQNRREASKQNTHALA